MRHVLYFSVLVSRALRSIVIHEMRHCSRQSDALLDEDRGAFMRYQSHWGATPWRIDALPWPDSRRALRRAHHALQVIRSATAGPTPGRQLPQVKRASTLTPVVSSCQREEATRAGASGLPRRCTASRRFTKNAGGITTYPIPGTVHIDRLILKKNKKKMFYQKLFSNLHLHCYL